MEILTLIPIMGMLAWFVDGFVKNNMLTPDFVLVLFIVSVLALIWAICTLFSWHRSSHDAMFVALVDLCFMGALIAGVYILRWVTTVDCVSVAASGKYTIELSAVGTWYGKTPGFSIDKPCAMLKACFALGIMNVIFFFFTAVLAWFQSSSLSHDRHHHHHRSKYSDSHSSRHRHRRHSGSRHSHRSSRHSGYV